MGATMEAQLTVPKPWWRSRTIWKDVCQVVISSLALIAGHQLIAENARTVAVLGIVGGVVGIILRKLTTQPLTREKP